jgi:hypothetical protein
MSRQDAVTSEQVLSGARARIFCACSLLAAILPAITGCSTEPQLQQPRTFASPYPGPKTWAVVPFRNETGTTLVDGAAFADHVVASLQQVGNITVLPTNRTIEAMRARRMNDVRTVEEAMILVEALRVDGIIVGTITAWDPYDPPKIGARMQLYSRISDNAGSGFDSRRITTATTDPRINVQRGGQPVGEAGGYFDAANHEVLSHLKQYATGRVPLESPSGYRRYLTDMNLYAEFVSHELMRLLFKAEWERITVPADAAKQTPDKTKP